MRRLTVLAAVTAITLSGCQFDMDGRSEPSGKSDKAVGELSPEDLCAMVKPERVEKLFDITVEDVTPLDSGAKTVIASSCVYEAERDQPLLQVSTMTEALTHGPTGKDALDNIFTAPEGEQHDYQTVEGLGDVAGFGLSPRAPKEIKTYELAVVDGEYTIRVFAEIGDSKTDEVALDQLRPLAEAILDKWDRP